MGSLSHRPNQLEGEFQTDLHYALASRANEWIAGNEIRRGEGAAEHWRSIQQVVGIDEAARTIGVCGERLVDHVEDLPARLDSITLPELEVFEDGHVQVLEARVAEDVPPHVSVLTQSVRG